MVKKGTPRLARDVLRDPAQAVAGSVRLSRSRMLTEGFVSKSAAKDDTSIRRSMKP